MGGLPSVCGASNRAESGQPLFLRVTRDGLDLGTDVQPFGLQTQFRDVADGGDLFHKRAIFDLGFRAGFLGLLSHGDVVARCTR